jgi:hypothetical protein
MDMHNAYRRLSDANLARSGGSLAVLSRRKRSDDANASGRLVKDYLSPDGDLLPEESSDEDQASSSDEEGDRGRKAKRNFDGSDNGSIKSPGLEPKNRVSQSLLAATEEERKFPQWKPSGTHRRRKYTDKHAHAYRHPSGDLTPCLPVQIPPG